MILLIITNWVNFLFVTWDIAPKIFKHNLSCICNLLENNLEGYLKVDSNYKLKLQVIFIFSVFLIHFVKQNQKTNSKLGCLRQMKAYCYQDLKERKQTN